MVTPFQVAFMSCTPRGGGRGAQLADAVARGEGILCPLLLGGFCVAYGFGAGGRVSPRRATHFLLLRQKKVSKEKATPLSATPALRYGATCGAQVSRGPQNSLRSNSCGPDPRNPPLLGAYRGAWKPTGLCFARPPSHR